MTLTYVNEFINRFIIVFLNFYKYYNIISITSLVVWNRLRYNITEVRYKDFQLHGYGKKSALFSSWKKIYLGV